MHDTTKRADDSSGGVKEEREHCSFATTVVLCHTS